MDDISVLNTDQESEKIVYKRRSSIFQKQINICGHKKDQTTSNIEHQLISNKNEKERNEVGAFNLVEYIENLKQERKDWHQEYRNRKCQRKDLAKQKACIEHQGQIMDMNVLTEYERAFLIGRPDYELICRNTQKLHDMTLKISMLNQLVHKVNQRFVNCMEKNIVLSIKEIIKMSEY